MLAIIDARAPAEVKENLKQYVTAVFEFSSEGITYNSISGHPDIFMFQDANTLIIAPNAPVGLQAFLREHKIAFQFGNKPVGTSLLESSSYNCMATETHCFFRQGYTDTSILKHCEAKEAVLLPQSYVRCSLFNLDDTHFISSDMGILKALKSTPIKTYYFEPSQIKIRDHSYGFLGGTVGKLGNTIFFMGDILKHTDGAELATFIHQNQQKYVCLGSDYLYDGGGLFFVNSSDDLY